MKYRALKITAAVISVLSLTVFSSGTRAETANICTPTKSARTELQKVHSEVPVSIGMGVSGSVIEVFASAKGAFTIIASLPNGTSCLIAAGERWEMMDQTIKAAKFQDF